MHGSESKYAMRKVDVILAAGLYQTWDRFGVMGACFCWEWLSPISLGTNIKVFGHWTIAFPRRNLNSIVHCIFPSDLSGDFFFFYGNLQKQHIFLMLNQL